MSPNNASKGQMGFNSAFKGLTNLMHKICFTVSLFHASTCFEHHVLIVRRSKLYYTASGIITPIGGRPVHGTATCRCDDTRLNIRCKEMTEYQH